jgi:hypothetical protein
MSSKRANAQLPTADLLKSLGLSLSDAQNDWEREELKTAPRFRSFSFFSPRETAVSRMIAALLNPEGTHGQGRAFLDLFLQMVKLPQLMNAQVRSVTVEAPTQTKKRIDIVISFTHGFNIGIENKVFGAVEQENQLSSYLHELANRRGDFFLLFLTDDALNCKSLTPEDRQRFREKIRLEPAKAFLKTWLAACQQPDLCEAPTIHTFLVHFYKYILATHEETFMTSSKVKQAVVEQIMSSPDTLKSAVAIREHLDAAIFEILNKLIERIYFDLADALAKSDLSATWKMGRHTELWNGPREPEEKPHPGEFNEAFEDRIWKYVTLSLKDKAAIMLEVGFDLIATRHVFGANIGVRKTGPCKKGPDGWAHSSSLSPKEELALTERLDSLAIPYPSIFHPREGFTDWHLRFDINDDFNLSTSEQAILKFYSILSPGDAAIGETVNFMLALAKEVSIAVAK